MIFILPTFQPDLLRNSLLNKCHLCLFRCLGQKSCWNLVPLLLSQHSLPRQHTCGRCTKHKENSSPQVPATIMATRGHRNRLLTVFLPPSWLSLYPLDQGRTDQWFFSDEFFYNSNQVILYLLKALLWVHVNHTESTSAAQLTTSYSVLLTVLVCTRQGVPTHTSDTSVLWPRKLAVRPWRLK